MRWEAAANAPVEAGAGAGAGSGARAETMLEARALRPRAELRLRDDERGTVTAEFAIVLPAVLVVLGLVIGGILIASHRITLISVAGEAARLEARGDTELARERLASLGDGVEVARYQRGRLECLKLSSRPGGGLLASIVVDAEACSVGDGAEAEQ